MVQKLFQQKPILKPRGLELEEKLKNTLGFWGIFISIIFRHNIEKNTEKEISHNGLPSPRKPRGAYLMSPDQGVSRTNQKPFTE